MRPGDATPADAQARTRQPPGLPPGAGDVLTAWQRAVAPCGERPALLLPDLPPDRGCFSHAALLAAVDRAAAWLRCAGAARGERVVLQLDKGLAAVLLHFGCLRIGAVSVPLNPRASAHERRHVLDDCGALLHVRAGLPAAEAPTPGGLRVLDVAVDEAFEEGPSAPPTDGPGGRPADVPPGTSSDARPSAPGVALSGDELACLVYTSGTTGAPKGVRLLQRQILAGSTALIQAWELGPHDRLLHVLPLFHVHGLFVALTTTLLAGGAVELARQFDPGAVWSVLRAGATSVFMGVPTMYHRLVEHADAARLPPALRLCTCGSAPLRPETALAFRQLSGRSLLERYGLTETLMVASQALTGPRRVGSVGRPLPGVALRVVDPQGGTELPAGAPGEVQVRGPALCDGYWRQPERSRELFTPDGWLRSGDLGRIEADGQLTLVGRLKELILCGGFNVSPLEVEAVLEQHPDVAECGVCGLPDDDLGEIVAAALVLHPGRNLDRQAFLDWARPQLSAYKLPRRVQVVAALPRTPLGKLARHELARSLLTPPPTDG